MKWSKRAAEIEALKAKHGNRRPAVQFPDLSVKTTHPSNSDGFGRVPGKAEEMQPPSNLIVDTLHKQGLQVLFKDDLPWAGGKKS